MADISDPVADTVDLFIIGGGVNGTGIARDAAGRGLSVALAEMGDLAQATSSASTKLFHGGLRYLEFFEFRLVRKALREREVLLRAMPHIARPMRFVLPYHRDMRFDVSTPAARLLGAVLPWTRGRRPAWMIRFGLWLYDHLGGRSVLPGTRTLDLGGTPEGAPLHERFVKAFEYSDCAVQDARLVVLNARDAAARGARILTRTRVVSARRQGDGWEIAVAGKPDQPATFRARALINAAGPWVGDVITDVIHGDSAESMRHVRGSHIVVRKLYDHQKCYFFQGVDGRIIFAIPFESEFTLIGTTDVDHTNISDPPTCTDAEADYLRSFANQFFKTPISADDIVWSFAGVRPLYDDGASSATAATRDYVLRLDADGAPLLNIFGGKITTYRTLSEASLAKLAPYFPGLKPNWTSGVPLPGGNFDVDGAEALIEKLCARYAYLDRSWAARLIRTYGTEAFDVLGTAIAPRDLGQNFGASLTARELDWAAQNEWVETGEDFLWRRTKLGLHLNADQVRAVSDYLASRVDLA